MFSSSEDSDSDSGTNFKRGKKVKEEVPVRASRTSWSKDDSRQLHDRREGKRRDVQDRRDKYSPPERKRERERSREKSKREHKSDRVKQARKSPDKPRDQKQSQKSDEKAHRHENPRKSNGNGESSSSRQRQIPSPGKPRSKEKSISKETARQEASAESYGPALPPVLPQKPDTTSRSMPKEVKRPSSPEPRRPVIGPALPNGFLAGTVDLQKMESSDEDDTVIGPMIPKSAELTERDLEFEKRKIEYKLQQLDKRMQIVAGSGVKHREEWMLTLPEVKKVTDLGLGARQFRKNERPDFSDRSSWTDTPDDNKHKHKKTESHEDKMREAEKRKTELEMRRRDEEQDKMAKQHKKSHKRDKTLLEIHEKKLQKEKVRIESTKPLVS
jgi:Protein of unknown function (DUF3752)